MGSSKDDSFEQTPEEHQKPEKEVRDIPESQVLPETIGEGNNAEKNVSSGAVSTAGPTKESIESNTEGCHQTQENRTLPKIASGPYSLVDLISSIPASSAELEGTAGAKVTAIETWDLNIYIGTSKGELLHYFMLDDEFGYMLISRQRINSKTYNPVKKIVIIPSILRALVLCNSSVSCFMMPEMSPAHIGKIKDVYDISLDISAYKLDAKKANREVSPSQTSDGVTAVLFTSKALRLVMVTSETMKLMRDVSCPDLKTGIRSSNIAIVGTNSGYNLLELDKGRTTHLFPTSSKVSSNSKLSPHVRPISTEEFLLSCGTEPKEPSIGITVNREGNITRGTISWTEYPHDFFGDYPHVISCFENKIEVHSIQDQQLLQSFEFRNEIEISCVSHVFNKKFEKVVDIIRSVPLVNESSELQAHIEAERQRVSKYANVTSSSVIYSAEEGVKLMIPTPMLKRILDLVESKTHLESLYDDLQDEIKFIDKSVEYGEIEYHFSSIMSGLILLQHYQFNRAFDYFVDNKLDPRLVVFLFEKDTEALHNEVWIFNGLKPKLQQIRADFQKLLLTKNPSDDVAVMQFAMDEFYRLLLKSYFKMKDLEPEIRHPIEVIHFLKEVSTRSLDSLQEIDDFVKEFGAIHNRQEIDEQLRKNEMFVVLAELLKSTGEHKEAVKIFTNLASKKLRDEKFALIFKSEEEFYAFLTQYIVQNCTEEDLIWKWGEWILERSPEHGVQLFSSSVLKVEISEFKVIRLLNAKGLYSSTMSYLEVLLLDKNEIQFIGDLIYEVIRLLVSILETDDSLARKMAESVDKYESIESPKLTFSKFTDLEFKKSKNQFVCRLHNRALNLILVAMKDTITITREQNLSVIKYCQQSLEPHRKQVPYLLALLDFKNGDVSKCIDRLCKLSDFKTAEYVATRLNFPYNLSNYSDKFDRFIEMHRTRITLEKSEDIDDEDATLAHNSIAFATPEGKGTFMEELLLQIFEYYLAVNNFQLIESFLNSYHLFDVTFHEDEGLEKVFQKFDLVLAKLPPNFPVALINKFLSATLIAIADMDQNRIKAKNLNKAVNKKLRLIIRDLKE